MRRLPAWFLATAALLLTAAPLRAGGRSACATDVPEGTWTRWVAPVTADWATWPGGSDSYRNTAIAHDGAVYGVTLDPWDPCVAYRIGTDAEAFTDRGVVQKTTDRGHNWGTVLTDDTATFSHVYVPAPGEVDLAVVDGPSGLRRSTDGGGTWTDDAGLAGHDVYSLTFAPIGARPGNRHEYAVTLPCHEDATLVADTACQPSPVSSTHFIGKVGFLHRTPHGSWGKPTEVPNAQDPRAEFAVRVDPADPGTPYVYDRPYLSGAKPAEVLAGNGLKATGLTTYTDAAHFQVCRRDGALLMLAYSNGVDQVSVAGGPFKNITELRNVADFSPTTFGNDGGCPLFQVRALRTGTAISVGHDVRAIWSPTDWNTETDVELGRFPSALPDHGPATRLLPNGSWWLPPDGAYAFEATQQGADGTYYVTVGRRCHTPRAVTHEGEVRRAGCGDASSGPMVYEWVTWAYRVPTSAGGWRTVDGGPGPGAGGTLPPGTALADDRTCRLLEGAEPGTGLAFDGRDLLYPEAADTKYTVTFARVDPASCRAVRTPLSIKLDPAALTRARTLTTRYQIPGPGTPTLDPRYADADTVTYDRASGDLYFSLRDNAKESTDRTATGNPASVWVSHDLRTASLLYVGDRCLDDPGNQAGMSLLAWDTDTRSLLTCANARPLPISASGEPLTPACLYNDTYRGTEYGWKVSSWTDAEDGRALVLVDSGNDASVVEYRPAACATDGAFGASGIATAKGGGGMHAQLACTPPGEAGDGSLLWYRHGGDLSSYRIPGVAPWCRTATSLAVTTAPGRTCATLTAPSLLPSDPAWRVSGRDVAFRLDGVTVAAPPTDAAGRTCVARSARSDARAAFGGDQQFLRSAGRWPPVPVVRPLPKPVVKVPPAPRPPAPEVVDPPGPVPPPLPVPVAQVPPPPPAPPGANVAGLTENREENHQLAMVEQEQSSGEEPSGVEELAAAALLTAGAFAVAWRRRAAEAVAAERLRR